MIDVRCFVSQRLLTCFKTENKKLSVCDIFMLKKRYVKKRKEKKGENVQSGKWRSGEQVTEQH